MGNLNNYPKIEKQKQNQILKLVTNTFYRELVNYGVDTSDIITVSVNLLDHVTNSSAALINDNGFYNKQFKLSDIQDQWKKKSSLSFDNVTIKPLTPEHVPQISDWLQSTDVNQKFINLFPREKGPLESYLLNRPDRQYFGIYYDHDHFVGIIGAENIDLLIRKLEMKKFIGTSEFRSKGIGKVSTFLFLFYAFEIIKFNKVYIHSIDTNILNINLNSKFGFELEGILFAEAFVNNAYRDVLRMGLLQTKWRDIFCVNK